MVVGRTKPERISVPVTVRLYGAAQIASGRKNVVIQAPSPSTESGLARKLAEALPELVGPVVRQDLSGLQASYTFNLNGTVFVSDGPLNLASGDTLLLFSSQAGG